MQALPSGVSAFAADLAENIRGEVRFDPGTLAVYSTDGSIYRQVPIGVVLPLDVEDVVRAVAIAREHDAPVLPRGGGTSLEGQCCNAALVIDFSKYLNKLLAIDPDKKIARVQPGIINDQLRQAAEEYGLTFGPDPATHNHCTIGGQIGNNSCGSHSVMSGRTAENIAELEILTYDGLRMHVGPTSDSEFDRIISHGGRRAEIYGRLRRLRDTYAGDIRNGYPNIPRRVSGYELPELLPEKGFNIARALTGTEGTCVTVLEATTTLIDSPPHRALVVMGYHDAFACADHVPDILPHRPIALEGFDNNMVEGMRRKHLNAQDLELLPEGGGWLLAEFGARSRQAAEDQARELIEALKGKHDAPSMKLLGPDDAKKAWAVRESGVGAVSDVPGKRLVWPGWEDSAVAPEKLGAYLRDQTKLFQKHGYEGAYFGHFGQGCVHVRIDFELRTAEGIANLRAFMEEAADLVVSYGGSLTGEHGDGQAHAELLPKMFGPRLMQAFREFKDIWDPDGQMNPRKLFREPYRLDENLRLGIGYGPPETKTHFQYPADHYNFARSQLRCIGVGKCRRIENGTMCPSYMVTREEKHSTRGRSRLLFEMLQGDVVRNGWRDEAVKESLDLCLACKGCKGECPVQVDMATYKAEFLSHYYAGRLRPASAYSMGLIGWWARLASMAPGIVNVVTQTPGLRSAAKALAGMPQQRQIPKFARQTFKDWYSQRGNAHLGRLPRGEGTKVILWPDTFNNYFHPETAMAAVAVLEAAGFVVVVPRQPLCCGRPLYDYGMLGLAKRWLRHILRALRDEIRAGTPVIGLEPSCLAVFRDELVNLFPHNEDARRLSAQSFLLSEFLEKKAGGFQPGKLSRKALVQGHCHQKSIMGMDAETAVLSKMGLDFEVLDSGCCGMAGSFGFEKDKYEISMKCGERVLLPAVRQAAGDTLIVANGFSCREQIAQGTHTRALHLAEVLELALHQPGER